MFICKYPIFYLKLRCTKKKLLVVETTVAGTCDTNHMCVSKKKRQGHKNHKNKEDSHSQGLPAARKSNRKRISSLSN